MTYWLSQPVESFYQDKTNFLKLEADYLIVGSGYGAAMAALAILEESADWETKPRVVVLERGEEYVPGDFPASLDELPRHLNYIGNLPLGARGKNLKNSTALWELRQGKGISVLSGSGLGGTSLVNAGVAVEPDAEVFTSWPSPKNNAAGYWSAELGGVFEKIKALLGVEEFPECKTFDKYQALAKTAGGLDQEVKPAQLTINARGYTPYSAKHGDCNACGNCVIGCHSGAKQSLNLNAWVLAKEMGATIVTGATVSGIAANPEKEPPGHKGFPWYVHGHATRDRKRPFSLEAGKVVLAAGAIGSTEILLKSRRFYQLPLSGQLGKGFSGNGDMIFSSHGQSSRVNALADVSGQGASDKTRPGPTILGKASIPLHNLNPAGVEGGSQFTLEEGAVPFLLIRVWQEMSVTQDLLGSFGGQGSTAWHTCHPDHDPLAISGSLAQHGQVLLAMGPDSAGGELTLSTVKESPAGTESTAAYVHAVPHWPKSAPGEPDNLAYYKAVDELFSSKESNCFDGGHYHPGVNWKPIPSDFSAALEGVGEVGQHLLTVHPLGGCAIGLDVGSGVVNLDGCVYDPGPGITHEGLYVMDGAILPGPVGTNPFITIASLSYVLARKLARRHLTIEEQNKRARECERPFPTLTREDLRNIPPGDGRHIPVVDEGTALVASSANEDRVEAIFRERLCCPIAGNEYRKYPWSRKDGPGLEVINTFLTASGLTPLSHDVGLLVLDIDFFLEKGASLQRRGIHARGTSLEEWIENPQQGLHARATLKYATGTAVHMLRDTDLDTVAEFAGQVILGERLEAAWYSSFIRPLGVLRRYVRYRTMDLVEIIPGFESALKFTGRFGQRLSKDLPDIIAQYDKADPAINNKAAGASGVGLGLMRAWWHVLKQHTDYRCMSYSFQSAVGRGVQLKGRKTLAYRSGEDNLWASLFTLPTTLETAAGDGEPLKLYWEMDAIRLGNGSAPLQLTSGLNFLTSLSTVGSAALYLMRVVFKTHFWSFAAPSYRRFKTLKAMQEKLPKADYGEDQGRRAKPPKEMPYGDGLFSMEVECHQPDKDSALDGWCRLIRYRPRAPVQPDKTLLLVHGLAHSSRVFWTHTVKTNFVQFFLDKQYDVWIVDHRTSANYVPQVDPTHTWDDVALKDIPWAVETVFKVINEGQAGNKRKVHVFAHCIGAGAVSIAALDGKLSYLNAQGENDSMLASLVPHAVTPWLFASKANRARENAWGLFKDMGIYKRVEPTPHAETPFRETVFDRIASSIQDAHEKKQWSFWHRIFDARGLDFAKTIYSRYTIFWGRQWWKANVNDATRREFASMIGATPVAVLQQVYFSITRGLLSNHGGNNAYVTRVAIEDYWNFPTLFFHGDRNTVFDMESSRYSADMLVRHRMDTGQAGADIKPLKPEDYLEHDVWVDIVPKYGHMDVIFGDKAERDIFPRLALFYSAVSSSTLYETYKDDARRLSQLKPDGVSLFHAERAPLTTPEYIRKPVTGPIISRPRVENDHIVLRVWCEAEDFTAMPARGLCTSLADENALSELLHRNNQLDGYKTLEDEFWLYELRIPKDTSEAISFWMDYSPDKKNRQKHSIDKNSRVEMEWQDMDWYQRLRQPAALDAPTDRVSWLLGSCHYPGTLFERDLSAAVFEGMWPHLKGTLSETGENLPGVDHLMFLGDQIYADATAGLLDPQANYEKYRARYRQQWSSEPAARLLRNVPCYFAIGDHEIKNDWPGRDGAEVGKDVRYARLMAWLFQCHGEGWDFREEKRRLYYNFNSGSVPFFVFDSRSERTTDPLALMSGDQLQEFDRWLASCQVQKASTIFIASGAPFGPVTRDHVWENKLLNGDDSLLGYPAFLAAIFARLAIVPKGKTICWLSGDPHLSYVADITLQDEEKAIKILHVVSSGLYAPIDFINTRPGKLALEKEIKLTLDTKDGKLVLFIEQTLISNHHQHFLRLDLVREKRGDTLQIRALNGKGDFVSGPHFKQLATIGAHALAT